MSKPWTTSNLACRRADASTGWAMGGIAVGSLRSVAWWLHVQVGIPSVKREQHVCLSA